MLDRIREYFTVEPTTKELPYREINLLYLLTFFLVLNGYMGYVIYQSNTGPWFLLPIFFTVYYLMLIFLTFERIIWEVFGVGLDEFLTVSFLREQYYNLTTESISREEFMRRLELDYPCDTTSVNDPNPIRAVDVVDNWEEGDY